MVSKASPFTTVRGQSGAFACRWCSAVSRAGAEESTSVTEAAPAWAAGAVASHEQLIEALRRGDVSTVVALTEGQFSDGLARLLAYLDQIGLWD